MVVRRLFNCCETIVEGFYSIFNYFETAECSIHDWWTIVEDCWMILKQLLDNCLTIDECLLHDF